MKHFSVETHERIIFWSKVAMFAAFGINAIRILANVWKYGGNKKRNTIEYDGDAGDDDLNDGIKGVGYYGDADNDDIHNIPGIGISLDDDDEE